MIRDSQRYQLQLHQKRRSEALTLIACQALLRFQITFYLFQVFWGKSPFVLSWQGWHFGAGSFPGRSMREDLLARGWQGTSDQSFWEFLS